MVNLVRVNGLDPCYGNLLCNIIESFYFFWGQGGVALGQKFGFFPRKHLPNAGHSGIGALHGDKHLSFFPKNQKIFA
jgi:hypothetical protein